MKAAFLKDDAFLADVESGKGQGDELAAWWLGQSGFLVRSGGRRVLFDPYLSDSLTRKYAGTDKPHVRLTERVVAPGDLERIALVTSSHNHTDHLDAETLSAIAGANPGISFALPAANRSFARERLGGEPMTVVEMDAGTEREVEGLRLHGIAAAHNEVERDSEGRHRFLGYVLELGAWRIFHSGDTLWHDGLTADLLRYRPQVAFLPINGNRPERRVAGNLNGAEAAALARAAGVRHVVPCHYDMFAFNTETPDLFRQTCRYLGQPFRILENGEGTVFLPDAD